jgi:hypothetical protein
MNLQGLVTTHLRGSFLLMILENSLVKSIQTKRIILKYRLLLFHILWQKLKKSNLHLVYLLENRFKRMFKLLLLCTQLQDNQNQNRNLKNTTVIWAIV